MCCLDLDQFSEPLLIVVHVLIMGSNSQASASEALALTLGASGEAEGGWRAETG